MIANHQEFEVTLTQLKSVEKALEALRSDLKGGGTALQSAAPQAYERGIAELRAEIAAFLNEHHSDLSVLTRSYAI